MSKAFPLLSFTLIPVRSSNSVQLQSLAPRVISHAGIKGKERLLFQRVLCLSGLSKAFPLFLMPVNELAHHHGFSYEDAFAEDFDVYFAEFAPCFKYFRNDFEYAVDLDGL
jgi:hypothetical protein